MSGKGLTAGIDSPQKAMIGDIDFRRKAMTEGIAFQRKGLTKGIGFHRKAMASTINIVVTVVVVFAVGLILYMIVSGNLTKFGGSTNDQQETDFNNLACVKACSICCLTGSANTEFDALGDPDAGICAAKDASGCEDCNCV